MNAKELKHLEKQVRNEIHRLSVENNIEFENMPEEEFSKWVQVLVRRYWHS